MSNLVWMQTVKYSAVTWLQALQERDLTLCGNTIHFCVKTSDDWKRGSDSFVGLLESAKWKTGPRCGIQWHRKSKWASRLVSVITNMKETLISPNWNEFFFFSFFCLKVVLVDYAHWASALAHHADLLLFLSVPQTYSTPWSGLKTAGSFWSTAAKMAPLQAWRICSKDVSRDCLLSHGGFWRSPVSSLEPETKKKRQEGILGSHFLKSSSVARIRCTTIYKPLVHEIVYMLYVSC